MDSYLRNDHIKELKSQICNFLRIIKKSIELLVQYESLL